MDDRTPILFLGDSPSGYSGLGRILRESALRTQLHLGDVLDVATIGLGAPPSDTIALRQFPMGEVKDWVPHDLPYAWQRHVGDREGILFCIWDVSRLLWLVHPEQCPDLLLRDFLKSFKGQKWIYPAIDGAGPNDHMPILLKEALAKFDRVLNYTRFSAQITEYPDVATHGIDTSVFYLRENAREVLTQLRPVTALEPGEVLIGIVATNQPRKDWAMAFGALALLERQGMKTRIWIHTDTDMRHWDLKSLYIDFGLSSGTKVFFTPYGIGDDLLAKLYSACNITLGIGPEGFGYPIAESLCCGTPCVTGSYGGQSDFAPKMFQVAPMAFRYEGIFGIQRPVYNSADFTKAILSALKWSKGNKTAPVCSWDSVWPDWEAWIRKGL
jgi:glycosyltransferase involved in cell wall biosynthesis